MHPLSGYVPRLILHCGRVDSFEPRAPPCKRVRPPGRSWRPSERPRRQPPPPAAAAHPVPPASGLQQAARDSTMQPASVTGFGFGAGAGWGTQRVPPGPLPPPPPPAACRMRTLVDAAGRV